MTKKAEKGELRHPNCRKFCDSSKEFVPQITC